MAGNNTLQSAKTAKNDEFYTQLVDIENELKHYKNHFKDKIVFCNCDDPFESNFFKYFAINFNFLGLKKLICTCYATSPVAWEQLSLFDNANVIVKTEGGKQPYKIEITEVKDYNGDGAVDLSDVEYLLKNGKNSLSILKGDGDFRSEECIDLLKQSDIVVTNPPFSLFREYVAQLIEYDKKFIIIGNKNAITYKEFFPLLKDNMAWLGYTSPNKFKIPSGEITQQVNGLTRWFTNLEISKMHENLPLYKQYSPEEYPKYDNYDAIEVNKVSNIPYDYYGCMGVPITFLDKYNPKQFVILGMCENLDLYRLKTRVYTSEECKKRYFELFGKNGVYDLNAAGVVNGVKVYQRILIRRKNDGN